MQELALAMPVIVREVGELPALRVQTGGISLLLNPKQLMRDESTIGSNTTIMCEAFEQVKVSPVGTIGPASFSTQVQVAAAGAEGVHVNYVVPAESAAVGSRGSTPPARALANVEDHNKPATAPATALQVGVHSGMHVGMLQTTAAVGLASSAAGAAAATAATAATGGGGGSVRVAAAPASEPGAVAAAAAAAAAAAGGGRGGGERGGERGRGRARGEGSTSSSSAAVAKVSVPPPGIALGTTLEVPQGDAKGEGHDEDSSFLAAVSEFAEEEAAFFPAAAGLRDAAPPVPAAATPTAPPVAPAPATVPVSALMLLSSQAASTTAEMPPSALTSA